MSMSPFSVRPPPRALHIGAAIARLVLAGVLGYAAATKIGDPAATVRAVRAYRLLPEGVAVPLAHALPAVELAVALLLLLGIALRLTAAVAAGLMAIFVAGIASAWARGLKIDCGCFGGGGATTHPQYALELTRDGVLLLLAAGLVLLGRSAWSLDPEPPPVPPEPASSSRADLRKIRAARGRAQEQQRRSRLHRRWLGLGAMAVLLTAAAAGVLLGAASAPVASSASPAGATRQGGILVGSASAPRHLVIFEDPQCPTCERFERTTGAVVQRAVAARTVQLEYRMRSFLGPESVRAVAALGAAAQEGRFEQLRAQMFADQPAEHTGGYSITDLLQRGASVGLTGPAYVRSVTSQTFAAWARRVDDQASKDGNVGTPELRLDGRTLPQQTVFTAAALARALGLS